MTEIEQAFYDTLKTLEQEQLKGLEALREESQQREIAFSKAVSDLVEQVSSLSRQVSGLSERSEVQSAQVLRLVEHLKR